MGGSYSDFNQYLYIDLKMQNCEMDSQLNLNKHPCWDSIHDPFASDANSWTFGLC